MRELKDLTGNRYGSLVVLEHVGVVVRKRRLREDSRGRRLRWGESFRVTHPNLGANGEVV